MPLFQTTIPIDQLQVAEIVLKNWNIKLGKLIKGSQNHTFEAFSQDDKQKFAVRVTPDPKKLHLQRIKDEIYFVNYLVKTKLKHLVNPIPPVTESDVTPIVVCGDLILVVFEWALGSKLQFMEFRWMKDKAVIFAWGRFFAQLHKESRKFEIQYPEVAKRIQNWDQVHCSILADTKLHPDDIAVINNPQHFGVIHGDLNLSNIYYVDGADHLSVFDTDQVQRGFYMFDMAQAIVTLSMLEQGGLPVSGTPVQGCSRKAFQEIMVAGYESEGLKVDLSRLDRMVNIKKQLYAKFAIRAFEQGNIPKDMEPFLKYIHEKFSVNWMKEE